MKARLVKYKISNISHNLRKLPLIAAILLVSCFNFCPIVDGADDQSIFDAVRKSDIDGVKRILTSNPGAVNALDNNGSTPLHVLSAIKQFGVGMGNQLSPVQEVSPIAEMLISKGANLDVKDNQGQTPLLCAIGRGEIPLAKFIIEKGADVNAAITIGDLQGLTPLHAAAGHGYVDVVKLLIMKGANLNPQMVRDGNTPLHIAAIYNYSEAAKILVEQGADVHVKNKKGQSPLDAALASKNKAVVGILTDNISK